MSERDDLTEQAYHAPAPPSSAVLEQAKAAGLQRGDSFTYDNGEEEEPDVWSVPLNRMQQQVKEFHEAMGQPVSRMPRPLPLERHAVRIELIREEFQDELLLALAEDDMVAQADAAVDLLYVVLGLLVEMGINAEVLFDEVHRSNMSKLGEDGKPIIAGENDPDGIFPGRVKKGPYYFKPRLEALLKSGVADL